MKKSIALEWVKALRSGKYKQTKGRLKDENGYCCLGVLCSISPFKNNYTKLPCASSSEYNSLTPDKVKNWAGLNKANPGPVEDNRSLASLNDIGKSFNEIADIIEENYKKL